MAISGAGARAAQWVIPANGRRNPLRLAPDYVRVRPALGDKFIITGRHAEGATCEVFKAHHVALDIGVAIKVLKPEHLADPRFAERMRLEAQILPRLKNRHIVQCFDRGVTGDGRPFTVLEFLRGETLDSVLERAGRFDDLATIDIGIALFDGLAAVHSHGVVHRDVSLRNLIVHRTEHEPATLKLIDFGFALVLPTAPESAPAPTEIPEPYAVGTPRFTAPEIALARPDIDCRADLYSAGAVLYTLLAGRDPFADLHDAAAILEAHAYQRVPPLSLYAPHVSPELEAVVIRLLAKERAERFASANDARLACVNAAEQSKRQARRGHTLSPGSRIQRRSSSVEIGAPLRPHEGGFDDAKTPIVVRLDQDGCLASWNNLIVQIWRGSITGGALDDAVKLGQRILADGHHDRLAMISIVEASSPPPRESVRFQYAQFFRDIAPLLTVNVVVAEGSWFRYALVRSVGTALTRLAHGGLPFTFVSTSAEAAALVAPHVTRSSYDETLPQVLLHIRRGR